MGRGVVAVVFEGGQAPCGGGGDGGVESLMASVRREICLDTIERLLSCRSFDGVILATSDAELGRRAAVLGAAVEPTVGAGFSVGLWLREYACRAAASGVVCLGGASAPLALPEDFAAIARALARGESVVVTNNLYSADIVAFKPPSAVERIPPPDDDNFLAYLLHESGLEVELLPDGPVFNFDVDTPIDLGVLAVHPRVGRRSARAVSDAGWGADLVAPVMNVLRGAHPCVFLSGRVSSGVMEFIRRSVRWRLKVVSEARGMKAFGEEAAARGASVTGVLVDRLGPEGFFEFLGRTCDAALIDTRVLFSHWGLAPSGQDRFNSDLKRDDEVHDECIRGFTRAAALAPIPVLLGGHTLVNGGAWAMADSILQELAGRSRKTSLEF